MKHYYFTGLRMPCGRAVRVTIPDQDMDNPSGFWVYPIEGNGKGGCVLAKKDQITLIKD